MLKDPGLGKGPTIRTHTIYHGNDDEDFDEWADQLEALCEISQ